VSGKASFALGRTAAELQAGAKGLPWRQAIGRPVIGSNLRVIGGVNALVDGEDGAKAGQRHRRPTAWILALGTWSPRDKDAAGRFWVTRLGAHRLGN
jgi:hypothetical protein